MTIVPLTTRDSSSSSSWWLQKRRQPTDANRGECEGRVSSAAVGAPRAAKGVHALPVELPLELDDLDGHAVHLSHHLRAPVVTELREAVRQIDERTTRRVSRRGAGGAIRHPPGRRPRVHAPPSRLLPCQRQPVVSRHPPDAPRGTWQRERSAGAQASAQGGHGSRGLLPQHHLTDALSPWSLRGPLGGRLVRGAGLRRVGSTVALPRIVRACRCAALTTLQSLTVGV